MKNVSVIMKSGEAKTFGLSSHSFTDAIFEAFKLIKNTDELKFFAVLDADEVEPIEIVK